MSRIIPLLISLHCRHTASYERSARTRTPLPLSINNLNSSPPSSTSPTYPSRSRKSTLYIHVFRSRYQSTSTLNQIEPRATGALDVDFAELLVVRPHRRVSGILCSCVGRKMYDIRPSAPNTPFTSRAPFPQGVPFLGRSISEPRSLSKLGVEEGLFASQQLSSSTGGLKKPVLGLERMLPLPSPSDVAGYEPDQGIRGNEPMRSMSVDGEMEGLHGDLAAAVRRDENDVVQRDLGLRGMFRDGSARRGREGGKGRGRGGGGNRPGRSRRATMT